ncbi:hypothetical protein ACFCWY_09170 [Streptomyces sp. NPDC056362]|uniref:hypothetical protein n=1 Tax=unclassified Streptomyces TaxID=2593676 RepID=UPI0035E11FCB
MSNDATDGITPEQAPQGISLQTLGLAGAVARLIDEHHESVVGPKKDAPKDALVKGFAEEKRTGLVVEIDGQEVGRYTVNTSKAKFAVTDQDAFLAFAEERDEVDYVTVPKKSFVNALLKRARRDPETGIVFDSGTGEPLPGVSFVPGGEATGNVTWTWTTFQGEQVGKEVVYAAGRNGRLKALLGEMPELLSGAVPE